VRRWRGEGSSRFNRSLPLLSRSAPLAARLQSRMVGYVLVFLHIGGVPGLAFQSVSRASEDSLLLCMDQLLAPIRPSEPMDSMRLLICRRGG
jgi:hypothetical protein